jgi:signal transduction histidine kinase
MELAEVSMLLDTISQSHHKNRYFQQLVANKKLNATLLLKAKLYSDSLLMQAYYLENNLSGIIGNDVKLHGTSSREFKEKTDTSIGQAPLAYQKNDKGLFKRIKDAIPNKPAKSDGQPVSAEVLSIKKPEEYDSDDLPVLSDTALLQGALWSIVLDKLAASGDGLKEREMALFQSNALLFGRLTGLLNDLQEQEFQINEERSLSLRKDTESTLRKIDAKGYWVSVFFLLLAAIILWFMGQFYKNSRALLVAKKEAENYARLKSKFAATVSHEIRGLTHTINASAEQLAKRQIFTRRKELLNNMRQSWETLLSMMNNILDYTKMEQDELLIPDVSFSPAKAVREVLGDMNMRADRKQLDLKAALSIPIDAIVLGNETRLKQVLNNLIGNAIKFTQKGYVSVEAAMQNKSDAEAVLHVRISDTGRGIRKEDIPHVFEEFLQIDPDNEDLTKGSGLGLAIVKRIIDQHKGKISIRSRVNEGSIFSFEIPYRIAAGEEVFKPSPSLETIDLSRFRLLIVENGLLQRKYVSIILINEGAGILEAGDGQEALKLLTDNEVDMVLTDVNMPAMDGIELTRRIRCLPDRRKASIPVIALTATISLEDISLYEKAGMNGHLVKPFTPQELIAKINGVFLRPEMG